MALAEKASANGYDLEAILAEDHGIGDVASTGDSATRGHAEFARAADAQTNEQGNQSTRRRLQLPAGSTANKDRAQVAGAFGAKLAAGIASTALCYLPALEYLCIGIDLILGHTPIGKRATYPLGKIPLVGEVGIETALTLANLVWGRIGLFEGGFGECDSRTHGRQAADVHGEFAYIPIYIPIYI